MTMLDLFRGDRQRSPMDSLASFSRDMESLFRDFDRMPLTSTFGGTMNLPTCDVCETEKDYVLEFDLPGVKKDEINIEVVGNQIVVSGERRQEEREEGKQHRMERRYGSFQRVFTMTDEIDADKIEADYSDGVLTVVVPKSEEARPRKISIGEGKGASMRAIGGEKSSQNQDQSERASSNNKEKAAS